MTAPITRRDLFKIVGLSAAAGAGGTAVAGCAPAEPTNDSSTTGGEFHGAWPYKQPPEGNFNIAGLPYAGVPLVILYDGIYGDLMNPPSAYYLWESKEWEYILGESHQLDAAGNSFTLKIKSGLKWSDGSALTSKDYLTTFYCQFIRRSTLWNFIKTIEAPDDTTVKITFTEPPSVIDRYILKSKVISTATYGEWADKAKALLDAGKTMDDPEGDKLGTEFGTFLPKEVIVSGPYNLDYTTVSNTQLTMVKNPTGYGADKVKFDKLVIYNGETTEVTPLVQSKAVDYATHGFPPASAKAFQSAGFRILKPPVYSGPALLMNLDKLPEFKDVRVRQALAHVLDRTTIGTVSMGDSGKGVVFMAGFSDVQVPDWISTEDQAKLNKYDPDPDKATQLLTDAGWKKAGDAWQTPAGKNAEYEIQFPQTFADWSAAGTNVAEQLTTFGIKVIARGLDDKQAPIDIDKGNFELAIQAWGSSAHPHPHFSFVADLFTHNIPIAKNLGGKGMGFELNVNTKAYGKLDLEQVVTQAGLGLDLGEQKANVTKAAIAFNELMPMIPLFERYGNNPALEGDRVKAFLPDDDPLLKNAPYADNFVIIQMYRGEIDPV